jgi:hypothetical protein
MTTPILILIASALAAIPRVSPLAEEIELEDFASLTGCWVAQEADGRSIEHWLSPSVDEMLGVSQTIREGKTAWYEYMRISKNEDGEITFTASPSGQETTSFRLVSLVKGQAVFENLAHDFPQFVIYHIPPADELLATIEGKIDGEPRSVDFIKHRTACD